MLLDELNNTSWYDIVAGNSKEIKKIEAHLNDEESQGIVHYPVKGYRFAALVRTPLDKVKCVIVGQDPYPGSKGGVPFATGLAFSVPSNIPMPASLKNINKELSSSYGKGLEHGDLSFWADQGVLLLNTVLTLRAGESHSHATIGWQKITLIILEAVLKHNPNAVFLGFGRFAHALYDKVGVPFDSQVRTSHPSPLGAKKTNKNNNFSAFLGSKCFLAVNAKLKERGERLIKWV